MALCLLRRYRMKIPSRTAIRGTPIPIATPIPVLAPAGSPVESLEEFDWAEPVDDAELAVDTACTTVNNDVGVGKKSAVKSASDMKYD